jgi:hypothetical protein
MKTIEVGKYKNWKDANTIKDILQDKSEFRFISKIIEAPNGLVVVASTYLEVKKKDMREAAKFLIDKAFWI